jgi:hypothetical protein
VHPQPEEHIACQRNEAPFELALAAGAILETRAKSVEL